MNSMFKDLGIFKLHSGNDPSLKQGLTFDSYRKKNLDSSNYDLLQQSTSSNMSSIVEAMSSINSNSLVGFQTLLEKYSYVFDSFKIDINEHLFYFLDINLFFIIGVLFLLFPCFLSAKLTSS